MDNRIDRLENKIDLALEKIGELAIIAAENAADLREHMRRTALNEESLSEIRSARQQAIKEYDARLESVKEQAEEALRPIHQWQDRAKFTAATLGACGGILVFLKEVGLLDRLITGSVK